MTFKNYSLRLISQDHSKYLIKDILRDIYQLSACIQYSQYRGLKVVSIRSSLAIKLDSRIVSNSEASNGNIPVRSVVSQRDPLKKARFRHLSCVIAYKSNKALMISVSHIEGGKSLRDDSLVEHLISNNSRRLSQVIARYIGILTSPKADKPICECEASLLCDCYEGHFRYHYCSV